MNVESAKIAVSKLTTEELGEVLKRIIASPMPDDESELFEIVKNPMVLLGRRMSQKWNITEDEQKWFGGRISEVADEKNDIFFKLAFDDGSYCFQKIGETLVDFVRGDLDLLEEIEEA